MKKLFRDRFDKKIAGICGGLGQFFGIDPTILRLIFIFLTILAGVLPFLILYIIGWICIPLGSTIYIQVRGPKLYRSIKDRKIAGICGGIAELLKVNSTIIRIVLLLTMVVTGIAPLFITYIIGTFITPEKMEVY